MTIFLFICLYAGLFGFGATASAVVRPSLYDDPLIVYLAWTGLVVSGLLVALAVTVGYAL